MIMFDFLEFCFGKKMVMVFYFLVILGELFWSVVILIVLGIIFGVILGFSFLIFIIFFVFIVIVYIVIGGLWVVVYIDIL